MTGSRGYPWHLPQQGNRTPLVQCQRRDRRKVLKKIEITLHSPQNAEISSMVKQFITYFPINLPGNCFQQCLEYHKQCRKYVELKTELRKQDTYLIIKCTFTL